MFIHYDDTTKQHRQIERRLSIQYQKNQCCHSLRDHYDCDRASRVLQMFQVVSTTDHSDVHVKATAFEFVHTLEMIRHTNASNRSHRFFAAMLYRAYSVYYRNMAVIITSAKLNHLPFDIAL